MGTSLGSFSLSAALMDALLAEFDSELAAKTASLDSDPHFWMPLTLKKADYLEVMARKGLGTPCNPNSRSSTLLTSPSTTPIHLPHPPLRPVLCTGDGEKGRGR